MPRGTREPTPPWEWHSPTWVVGLKLFARGERGVALNAKDRFSRPYNEWQLARIHLLVGEPEKALDRLEALLKVPCSLSPGWLKIDPTFAPLPGQPALRAAGERVLA
jgi:hypothetical protein